MEGSAFLLELCYFRDGVSLFSLLKWKHFRPEHAWGVVAFEECLQ